MSIRWLRFFSCFVLLGWSFTPLSAATYRINGDLVGQINYHVLQNNETLSEVARRFDIGLVELLAANPQLQLKNYYSAGVVITLTNQHILPAERNGIVMNLSEMRLFYFPNATQVMTFPISIGKEGWQTPLGTTSITQKRANPEWVPTDSIRQESPHLPARVPAGPDNPLGMYALNLGWPSYAIHGTNRPYSVGKPTSHGCIRLYPEDIEALFNAVTEGTPVTVIDMAYKLGWQEQHLFLEVTPTQQQAEDLIQKRKLATVNSPQVYQAIKLIAQNMKIDWQEVDKAVVQRTGVPVIISSK